ncbi:MAG: hypothetical protein LM577_07350, partial [Thermoproteaceae archaeon]|nr:hypothetical protein [Thermoproteaceae archaeon]
MSELYERVVEEAYPRVRDFVRGRRGVFILVPQGSSRGRVLAKLLGDGAVDRAYAYPGLAGRLDGVQPFSSPEQLVNSLRSAGPARVAVAVESSIDALLLKERLGEGPGGGFDVHILYLPEYYRGAARGRAGSELLEVAKVRHERLGEGVSTKLLRPGELEELRRGRDVLLGLSHGAVGLRELIAGAAKRFPIYAVSAALGEFIGVGAVLTAAICGLLLGDASLSEGLVRRFDVPIRGSIKDFIKRLLEGWLGRRDRDKVAAGFARLAIGAVRAEPYIDDERFEALVDQVAFEWGVDVQTFKALVKNLAAMARGELVTKEELGRQLAQYVKRGELEKVEEAIRREVENKLTEVEKELEEVKKRLAEVKEKWEERWGFPINVLSVEEVGAGKLYDNFRVEGGTLVVNVTEGTFRLVRAGRFEEAAAEVLRRLASNGMVILRGPKGVGKSTLAAYATWRALLEGLADHAARIQKMQRGQQVALNNVLNAVGERRLLAVFDPSPLEFYIEPGAYPETTREAVSAASVTLEELLEFAEKNRGRGLVLAVLPDDLYDVLDKAVKRRAERYALPLDLREEEFLTEVIYEYSRCRETPKGKIGGLAEKIAEFNGGYTLAARYAGLWLRDNGCIVGDVERAVEASKKDTKLFFAHYIWHVLLRGSGDLARKAAAPLLLHVVFGPVPAGVAYVAKGVSGWGIWRLLRPEELEGASLESLKEDALEPAASWLAQPHEDLVKETLEDLAGINGEGVREQYREALGELIDALDWARREVLKEGGKILAELGVPERESGLGSSLLAFVGRRLAAIFKGEEAKRCWRRAALIAGFALAGHPALPRREQLPEDAAKALGDALEPCAVDAYLAADGEIPPLSALAVRFPYYIEGRYASDPSQIRKIRETLSALSPLAGAETVNAARKIAEDLTARWKERGFTRPEALYASGCSCAPVPTQRGFTLPEALYALGLAALAAGAEVDEKTADLLLDATLSAVQRVASPKAVLPVLAALRPLGERAPHRYVHLLAAASELETLDPVTVRYIYDALQQLKDRLHETGRLWPLVEAVRAYSNLLTKHPGCIRNFRKAAVADMCRLYGELKGRGPLGAAAKAYVLAAALEHDDLAPDVQRHCGLGGLAGEAEDVRRALDEATASPEKLKSDVDFAEWVAARSVARDAKGAKGVVEKLRSWFTFQLAIYKVKHAVNERGEVDAGRLEEAAGEFEGAAETCRRLEDWANYLAACGSALRARALAAKSLKELLERAGGSRELWEEAEKRLKPTAGYLEAAATGLGEYLVHLAASGEVKQAEELLKKWRWLLDYDWEVSAVTRLALRLFGVGEEVERGEVVEALGEEVLPTLKFLWRIAGEDECLWECTSLE